MLWLWCCDCLVVVVVMVVVVVVVVVVWLTLKTTSDAQLGSACKEVLLSCRQVYASVGLDFRALL